MKTQFTSGLYVHPDSPTLVRRESDDATVAQMDDGGHPDPEYCDIDEDEQAANALLFAAAPVLLRELQKARNVINALYVGMAIGDEGRAVNLATFDAAIAKAIGQ